MEEALICQCGCGEIIPPRPSHRPDRKPRYILSHFCRIRNGSRIEALRAAKLKDRAAPPSGWIAPDGFCQCGCGRPTSIAKKSLPSRGIYAGYHYRFSRGHGTAFQRRGLGHPAWRGERHLDFEGYVLVYAPNYAGQGRRYVLEHRLVFEQAHGVKLNRTDVIHHINGDKTDNRIENLVRTTQSVHRKAHPLSKDQQAKMLAGLKAWSKRRRQPADPSSSPDPPATR